MRPLTLSLLLVALSGCLGATDPGPAADPAAGIAAGGAPGTATGEARYSFIGTCGTADPGCWGTWETESGSFRVAAAAAHLELTAEWAPVNPTAETLRLRVLGPDDRLVEAVGESPLTLTFEAVEPGGYDVDVTAAAPVAAIGSQAVAWTADWS